MAPLENFQRYITYGIDAEVLDSVISNVSSWMY